MPAPPTDARSFLGKVVSTDPCGDDAVILTLAPEVDLPPIRASRFFMLKCLDRDGPLIPRPFSIYRHRNGHCEFLIKVMGRGTRALARCQPGESVRMIGPLGNGWPTLDGSGAPWVMIAGGVGSAPFPMAIDQAVAGMDGAAPVAPAEMTLMFGAATRGLLYDLDAFRATGVGVHAATDDGSEGFQGNVLEMLQSLWERGEVPGDCRLLACGPERMLEAVEDLARERGLQAWLSLETLMGCGVGICNGCPVPTLEQGPMGAWPNAKCCVEGPVFSLETVTMHATQDHRPSRGRTGN